MQTEQTERLLYDWGKNPLWLRLLFTPGGLGFVWAAYELAFCSTDRHYILDPIAAAASAIFGLGILSLWLPKGKLYYDPVRQLVLRRSGVLWRTRRISLSGAEAVYVDKVKEAPGLTVGGSWEDISIRYQGGRDRMVARQPLNDPDHVAANISEATGLPITEKPLDSTTSQIWASRICVTALLGFLTIGPFFIKTRQPEWFMWIIRCFVVVSWLGVLFELWRRKRKR